MKRNIYYFNNLLRAYNKYRRKLANLRRANKNERRQQILQNHIARLFDKLTALKMSIKMSSVAASVVVGALAFSPQDANAQSFAAKQFNPFGLTGVGNSSAPTFADLDGDGDYDMLVGSNSGTYNYTTYSFEYNFKYYENTGTASSPVFGTSVDNPFGITSPNTYGELTPCFVDIDGDGDMDIMYGNYYSPMFYFLENTGTATSPSFAAAQINPFGLTDFSGSNSYSAVMSFADIDNDGDLDMITGEYYGDFYFFENTGTATVPVFGAPQANPFGLYGLNRRTAPAFIDMDNDGDFDILSGERDGNFYYFENTGTAASPAFAASQTNPFNLTFVGYYTSYSSDRSKPTFVDLDNDGDMDLMAGDDYGDFNYYRRCTPTASTITTAAACSYTSPSGMVLNASGTYTDIMTNFTGCDSVITINLTINPVLDQSFVSTNPMICAASGSTTVSLNSSQSGVSYYLRDNSTDAVVDGPIMGTGSGISFNTGVISSSTTYNVYAENIVSSVGLAFDGNDDYVDAGSAIDLSNSSFSVEFWAKKAVLNAGGDNHIIGLGDNTTTNNALHIGFRGSNSFTFAFFGNDLDASSTYADVNWNHWAVTFDAVTKERKIYKNGVVIANDVSSSNFLGTGDLKIGRAYFANNNNFNGQLDEVRIWNVTRTGTEINANLNNCLSGSESGLLAYYKFEDGIGSSTLTDVTSNGNDGTLMNMDPNADWGMGVAVCSSCNLEMSQVVTVTINPVDNTVDNSSLPALSANQSGATYQWVDCNNGNAPISGETSQTYTATSTGSYAVEVTYNGCTVLSACESVVITGLNEASSIATSIYPNPTNGIVNINVSGNSSVVDYVITTIEGKTLSSGRSSEKIIKLDLSKEVSGIYFLKLISDETTTVTKLIKQ